MCITHFALLDYEAELVWIILCMFIHVVSFANFFNFSFKLINFYTSLNRMITYGHSEPFTQYTVNPSRKF